MFVFKRYLETSLNVGINRSINRSIDRSINRSINRRRLSCLHGQIPPFDDVIK